MQTLAPGFYKEHNPIIRHTVLRRRKTLEEAGLLERVAVEIHPDPNRATHAYPGLGFEGLGLLTNHPFDLAYQSAENFIAALPNKAGGFMKTLLLQRICSSFASGIATAQKLLRGEGDYSSTNNDVSGWGGRLVDAIGGSASIVPMCSSIPLFCHSGNPKNRLDRTVHVSDSRDFALPTHDPNDPLSKHPLAARVTSKDPNEALQAFAEILRDMSAGKVDPAFTEPAVSRSVWSEIVTAADAHYEPGRFTTFPAFEWTSNPNKRNLHRVIVFRDSDTLPELAYSAFDSEQPEDLWRWMEAQRQAGDWGLWLTAPDSEAGLGPAIAARKISISNPWTVKPTDRCASSAPWAISAGFISANLGNRSCDAATGPVRETRARRTWLAIGWLWLLWKGPSGPAARPSFRPKSGPNLSKLGRLAVAPAGLAKPRALNKGLPRASTKSARFLVAARVARFKKRKPGFGGGSR